MLVLYTEKLTDGFWTFTDLQSVRVGSQNNKKKNHPLEQQNIEKQTSVLLPLLRYLSEIICSGWVHESTG